MSEWFWFVLKFPLIVFVFLLIGAIVADPSLLLVIFQLYGWPFRDGGADDLFSRKFARRLGITVLCWLCSGTALFCWLKWGADEKTSWGKYLGVTPATKEIRN